MNGISSFRKISTPAFFMAFAGLLIAPCVVRPVVSAAKDGEKPPAAAPQPVKEKSLYERLGGVYAIATVVDDFVERLLVDDVLNANPKIKEARARVPKAGLKFQVTALVCQSAGGPQKYAGRSMKKAHEHLAITEKEWTAMAADFRATLNQFKVPLKEQMELFSIAESVKADIVVPAAPASPTESPVPDAGGW